VKGRNLAQRITWSKQFSSMPGCGLMQSLAAGPSTPANLQTCTCNTPSSGSVRASTISLGLLHALRPICAYSSSRSDDPTSPLHIYGTLSPRIKLESARMQTEESAKPHLPKAHRPASATHAAKTSWPLAY
jgi:hypothetical protein